MTHRIGFYIFHGEMKKDAEKKKDDINFIRFFAQDVTISCVRYCVENEKYFLLHFFFYICEIE